MIAGIVLLIIAACLAVTVLMMYLDAKDGEHIFIVMGFAVFFALTGAAILDEHDAWNTEISLDSPK